MYWESIYTLKKQTEKWKATEYQQLFFLSKTTPYFFNASDSFFSLQINFSILNYLNPTTLIGSKASVSNGLKHSSRQWPKSKFLGKTIQPTPLEFEVHPHSTQLWPGKPRSLLRFFKAHPQPGLLYSRDMEELYFFISLQLGKTK